MASSGPNYAGTAANDASHGTTAFTNPTNAQGTEDDTYAATFALSTAPTQYLKATNFGFAIPSGATIDGIVMEVRKRTHSNPSFVCKDSRVRIVKGGTVSDTDLAKGTSWPTIVAWDTYGDSTTLWGETWTADDINSSDFGVVISAVENNASDAVVADIDAIRITVHYTEGASQDIVNMSIFKRRKSVFRR